MIRLILFQLITQLIQLIPVKLVPFVAWVLTQLTYKFAKKDRKILYKNIEKIYGLASHSSFAKMFAMQVFRHQVISAVESIKGLKNPELITMDGFSELQNQMQEIEKSGLGLIYITAHLGSWELNGAYAAKATNKDFYALAKPAKQEKISEYVGQLRESVGIKVLWTHKSTLFRSMIKVMKTGQWLSFVMDQKPDNRVGTTVSFFGHPTTLVNGPAAMAKKFQAPMLAVYCVRIGPFHYKLISELLLEANHGLEDQTKICHIAAASMERVIKEYPEQWCWNYKRWNFSKDQI